jgi:hypothetical protein
MSDEEKADMEKLLAVQGKYLYRVLNGVDILLEHLDLIIEGGDRKSQRIARHAKQQYKNKTAGRRRYDNGPQRGNC